MKEAQRESKRRGLGVLQVGDPLLDLIGMLVGGVIATFDQFGSDGDLERKLAALKDTPRSQDRPVYRAYEFERSTVRAGKEATIPIACAMCSATASGAPSCASGRCASSPWSKDWIRAIGTTSNIARAL